MMTPSSTLLAVVVALSLTADAGADQTPRQAPAISRASVSVEDASLLAEGWALLAKGNVAGAQQRAETVLLRSPRSVAALMLGVEADLVGPGFAPALDRYEQWLGHRSDQEPGVLRVLARGLLVEVAGQTQNPRARALALKALGEAGETVTLEGLRADAYAGGGAETEALALAGDPPAVQILIAQLTTRTGNPLGLMSTLGASRQPAAVAPLAQFLSNPEPVLRAGAAKALGILGDPAAIPGLKTAFRDRDAEVRLRAAGALYRLGDTTGRPFLEELARAPVAKDRLAAAEALARQPDSAWTGLVRTLTTEPDPDIRLGAATLLATQDPESARPVLEALANDANPAIRDEAVRAMVVDLPSDLGVLRGWLHSTDRIVRVSAAGRLLDLTR